MGPDQKLHQARNGTLLSERGVVGRAQCQVTDQPDGGLGENTGSVQSALYSSSGTLKVRSDALKSLAYLNERPM